MKTKILIVDDEEVIRTSFTYLFKETPIEDSVELVLASTCEEGLRLFKKEPDEFSVALLDYQFKSGGVVHSMGHKLASEIKKINPEVLTVMISGDSSQTALKDWIDSGVDKYLYKPISKDVLMSVVQPACAHAIFKNQDMKNNLSMSEEQKIVGLIGVSQNIKNVCQKTALYAKADGTVLIMGETGTGKEIVARALHDNSEKNSKPFVAINCAAIADTLFESTLFGHVKGAFTDAKVDKKGIFREADGGTVFLDEIHHLSLSQQAALLRVLQEKKVTPIGSSKEFPVDFRLVVAGKENLRELADKGQFSPDLFFRIKGLDILIYPLRKRKEDVPVLIQHFQSMQSDKTGKYKKILPDAVERLSAYDWPGNVRELEREIEKLYVVSQNKKLIKESDISEPIKDFRVFKSSTNLTYDEMESIFDDSRKLLIISALKKTDNNIAEAARHLGLKRSSLFSKMEKLGLQGKSPSKFNFIIDTLKNKKGVISHENFKSSISSAV